MSKFLSDSASAEFDGNVKHAYQTRGGLGFTVTTRDNVVGDIYNFRSMGKGLANQKSTSEDVSPMNISHAKIPVTLENWNAPEYTDIFDAAEVNFDEVQELSQTIGGALGRREDQLIIDALITAVIANTVSNDIGGTDSDLNTAKFRRSSRLLNSGGVPAGNRHILVSAQGVEAMLGTTEATSSDFNSVKALVNGEVNSFVGFMVHMIEDRDEDGLDLTASDRQNFAYHSTAVGLARGIAQRTNVDWIPVKTSWLANGLLKANAIVRDLAGTVEITTREA